MTQDPALRLKPLWLVLGWMMVATVVYLALMPYPPQPMDFNSSDKLEHAAAFAGMTLWFFQIVAARRRLAVGAALLLLGIGIEIAQSFTPTRDFEYADMVADGVGILMGAWLARGWAGKVLATLERKLLARES